MHSKDAMHLMQFEWGPRDRQEVESVREAARGLARHIKVGTSLTLAPKDADEPAEVELKAIVVAVFKTMLDALAAGDTIARIPADSGFTTFKDGVDSLVVVPGDAELTPLEAARLLRVSGSAIDSLLENGEIPSHEAGSQRRVYAKDVAKWQEYNDGKRREALDQLATLTQELGIRYE